MGGGRPSRPPPPWLRLCHKLPKIRNFDCEYLENGKLQGTCQMGRNIIIGWTIAFQKCIAWDGSPQGVPYKENIFLSGTDMIYLASIGVEICTMVELCPVRGFLHFWWRYPYGSPTMGAKWFLDNLSSSKMVSWPSSIDRLDTGIWITAFMSRIVYYMLLLLVWRSENEWNDDDDDVRLCLSNRTVSCRGVTFRKRNGPP